MTSFTKKLTTALLAATMAVCMLFGLQSVVYKPALAADETLFATALAEEDLDIDENNVLQGLKESGINKVNAANIGSFSFTLPATVTSIADAPINQGLSGLFAGTVIIENVATGEKEPTFVDFTGKLTGITIPQGSQLTSIGRYAFYRSGLTSLDLSNATGLETIGDSAFSTSSKLTTVIFNSGLKTISASAFNGCSALATANLPEGLITIGESAFRSTALTTLTIPSTVKNIGNNAFRSCTRLTQINYLADIESTFGSAGSNPFYGAGISSAGITLTIGSDATQVSIIPGNFFYTGAQDNLKTVVFANVSATVDFRANAFYNCQALENVTLNSDLKKIGASAFRNNTALKTITIPATVTEIGNNAFYGCSALQTVNYGENSQLTTIGTQAFSGCSALTEVIIPANVTSIGSGAFANCTAVTTVNYFAKACADITSNNNAPFVGVGTDGFTVNFAGTAENKITKIPARLFSNTNVTEVTFTNLQVAQAAFGTSAFASCSNLKSVAFDDTCSVKSIGTSAFSGCSLLSNLTLPADLITINENAFSSCSSLMAVTVPATVTTIASNAFSGCTRLFEVKNLSNTLSDTDIAKVFTNAYHIYKTGDSALINQGDFTFILDTRETAQTNDTYNKYLLISYNGSATEVTLPQLTVQTNQLYVVYQYAFRGSNVTKITVPANVIDSLASYAFAGCRQLTDVTLPDNLTEIPQGLFNGCTSLTQISLPQSVKIIGAEAFYGSGLEKIDLTGITEIGVSAFYGTALTVVNIPESIERIDSDAFSGCEFLLTVYLPALDGDEHYYATGIFTGCSEDLVIMAANSASYNRDRTQLQDSRLTYVIKLNLVYNNQTYTEDVLFGREYGFKLNEETKVWEKTESTNGLPVQKGYSVSVWYEDADWTTEVDRARLKVLLSGNASVTLYAKYVAFPEDENGNGINVQINYALAKGGVEISEDGLNSLISSVYRVPDGTSVTLARYNNSETNLPTTICDAGIYEFLLEFDPNANYGELENKYLRVQVLPETIDITTGGHGEDTRIEWGYLDGGSFTALFPGNFQTTTLYIYNDTPYLVQQADLGGTPRVVSVIDSYLLYRNSNYTLRLNANSDLFEVISYSDNIARDAGRYVSRAVIKLNSNYQILSGFVQDEAAQESFTERLNLLGLTIIPNDIDGTVTIEKVWYIVASVNEVLDSTDTTGNTPYSITGWVYNNANKLPKAPVLTYCNDQVSTLITFTLTLDGKAIMTTPATYAEFGDYFNAAMPAGNYVLRLIIGACSEVNSGVAFPRSERQYTFTIDRANLLVGSLGADADKLKGQSFEYEWDGRAHYYDAESINLPMLDFANLYAIHPDRTGTAWAKSEYNDYYAGFQISYNLLGQQSRDYFTANDPNNEYKPINPGDYTVYFQLSAPGYIPLVDTTNDELRSQYFFTVNIHRTVSEIEVSGTNYTGQVVRPLLPTDSYLKVIWLDDEGFRLASAIDREVVNTYMIANFGANWREEYVSAGHHKFVLKIEDTRYYQWDRNANIEKFGAAEEYALFDFQIYEAENVATTHLSLISWSWNSYQPALNPVIWVTQFGTDADYTFTLILNRDDSVKFIKNGIIDQFGDAIAGEYTLRAECRGGEGYGPIREEITVNIQQATNYWSELPNLERWVYGNFKTGYVAPTATPAYRAENSEVMFYYYKADANHNAITTERFNTIDELLVDGEVPAGRYVLVCELLVDDESNFSGLMSQVKFTVLKADNYWTATPHLSDWTYGDFSEKTQPIAQPRFGEVSYFTYYKLDGNGNVVGTPYYAIDDMTDDEGQLPVGRYKLTVTVSSGDNYNEMSADTEFTVSRLANYWTETPNVVRWYYGEYDKGVNLISAVPAYGTASFTVYTISDDVFNAVQFTNESGATVTSFVLDEDGFVPSFVASKLITLNAGDYYLLASVEEAGSYSGINNNLEQINLDEATLTFNVLKSQNYWVNIPTIIGWIEGKYDDKENAISVLAKYGDIILTVTDRDGKVITTNADGATFDISKLKNLSIGNYELNAFVAVGDNYSGLDSTTTFAVFEDSVGVSGLIAAFMVFAVFALLLAVATVVLLILRRRKLEAEFRKMIHTELNRR